MKRRRLQIPLGPAEEQAFERIRELGENDADAGRRAIALVGRLAAAVDSGFVIVAVPADETRFVAVAPELKPARQHEQYRHLAYRPHPWRRQLSLRGRRITVGQLVFQMRANRWDAETTAREFDVPLDAVLEAVDYAAAHEALLKAEAIEDRRRSEFATIAPPAR